MIPMNEFRNVRKDMHGRILLLRASLQKTVYMLGHYDAVDDIFYVTRLPYMVPENTDDEKCSKMSVSADERTISVYTDEWKDICCLCPKALEKPMGMLAFDSFMQLRDVLCSAKKMNAFRTDIENILREFEHTGPYLVITNDKKICISTIESFNISGEQFTMCVPNESKTEAVQAHRILPKERIQAVVDISKWEKSSQNRLADVDELYKDIAVMDLSYMQQDDVMICIKDCMERHLRKAGSMK